MKRLLALFFIMVALLSATPALATVPNTTYNNTYTASGVNSVFAFTWRLIDPTQMIVQVNAVTQNPNTYTVFQNSNGIGGTVTFNSAPAGGATVLIQRNSDYLQVDDLANNAKLPPRTLEDMTDKAMIAIQQLANLTAGIVGPTGPQGPAGATGPAGPAGPIGPAGTSNQFTVFTPTQLSTTTAGALCVDGANNIWAAAGNTTISRIDTTKWFQKNFAAVLPHFSGQGCIVYNPFDGNIYVAEYTDSFITKLNGTTGAFIAEYAVSYNPYGLAVDGAGNVWYSTDAASFAGKITTGGVESTYAITHVCHAGLAYGADGRVYYPYAANAIGAIDGAGVLTDYTTGVFETKRILAANDGNLYYCANSQLYKMTTAGAVTSLVSSGVINASGLAQAQVDNAIWACATNNFIQRFALDGSTVSEYYLPLGLAGNDQQLTTVGTFMVVVDSAGSLWVYPQ